MPEDHTSRWENAISEVFRSGQPQDLEFDFSMPTGTKTFYLQLVPERDKEEGVRYVLGIVTDISERKRLEEDLNRKYCDLNVAYEEISSIEQDLRNTIDNLSKSETQLNNALAEKEVLLREIHHRVKNNLSTIIALINLQLKTLSSESDVSHFKDLEARIRSMVLVHEILYKTQNFSEISMGPYIQTLVQHLRKIYDSTQDLQFEYNLDPILLPIDVAIPCGIVVNEIITNILKYAYPPGFSCEQERNSPCIISITMKTEGQELILIVADNGIGMPIETLDLHNKIGLSLIRMIVTHQIGGSVDISSIRGTQYTVTIPWE